MRNQHELPAWKYAAAYLLWLVIAAGLAWIIVVTVINRPEDDPMPTDEQIMLGN
jgi:hypothetical protein